MPNGTRKSQSTRHSNNARNTKKERAKRSAEERERRAEEEQYRQFGLIDSKKDDENTKWAKRVSRDLFYTPRNKIVLCCEDNPRATQIVNKYIRKNGGDSKVIQGLTSYVDNKRYWCIKKNLHQWQKDIQPKVSAPTDEIRKEGMSIMGGLLLHPPKCNGEKFNISCGFLGSIWIDTAFEGVDYRIALYNNGRKDYDIKNFNPVLRIDTLSDTGFTLISNDGNGRVDTEVKPRDPQPVEGSEKEGDVKASDIISAMRKAKADGVDEEGFTELMNQMFGDEFNIIVM